MKDSPDSSAWPVMIMIATIAAFGVLAVYAWQTYLTTPSAMSSVVIRNVPIIMSGQTLLAVGDIADCAKQTDEAVADILKSEPGTIATLGDTVYDSGTTKEFQNCFDPAFGALRSRIRPAPGNHDYATTGAAPYYSYFGSAAGQAGQGYYSYELGSWHIIVLNSNCGAVGCGPNSAQVAWLKQDLKDHPTSCSLAYYHHPRFSSGFHGNADAMSTIWGVLNAGGVDVVLNGHDHAYERFASLDADGLRHTPGTREFVVGTGGESLYIFRSLLPTSEVRQNTTYGVLKLTLSGSQYAWKFLPVAGKAWTDEGSDSCH